MTTMLQVESNRRNAAKSTGPRTDEGKAESRRNAVTHGLTAIAFVPQRDVARFEERVEEWKPTFAPDDQYQDYHLKQAVAASLRVEHCQATENHRREELIQRAAENEARWRQDRANEVRRLSQSLKRNPDRVVSELKMTALGRDWLIEQWVVLSYAVRDGGESRWTETQTNEALDLLGIRKSMRALLDPYHRIFADPVQTRELIRNETSALNELQAIGEGELEALRASHAQGFFLEKDEMLRLARRYEADADRCLRRATKEIAKAKQASLVKEPGAPNEPTRIAPQAPPPREQVARESSIVPVTAAKVEATPVQHAANAKEIVPTQPPKENRRLRRNLERQARREAYLSRKATQK